MDITELAMMKAMSGGGVMVVHFDIDPSTGEIIAADKTVDEVYDAMFSMSVVGVAIVGSNMFPLGPCTIDNVGNSKPAFSPLYSVADNKIVYLFYSDGTNWKFRGGS